MTRTACGSREQICCCLVDVKETHLWPGTYDLHPGHWVIVVKPRCFMIFIRVYIRRSGQAPHIEIQMVRVRDLVVSRDPKRTLASVHISDAGTSVIVPMTKE